LTALQLRERLEDLFCAALERVGQVANVGFGP
jgi:hypothetical protein